MNRFSKESLKSITRVGLGLFAALTLYLVHQLWVWSPYFQFYQGSSFKALLKLAATTALFQPFNERQGIIAKFGNDIIIYEPINSELHRLITTFPPPDDFLDPQLPFNARVTTLREYVASILPDNSVLPQSPEPVRAMTLLGQNPEKAKYPKLCSKLAKIMVQYLSSVGIVSRIVQLNGHIAVEVYHSKTRQWELQDPFFNAAATFQGKPISAATAHDLMMKNMPFTFSGPKKVFLTVGFVPRNNFAQDHLPSWHYFNYVNLDYWRILRISNQSADFWKRLYASRSPH